MFQKLLTLNRQDLSRILGLSWLVVIFLGSVYGRKIQRLFPGLEPYIPYFGIVFMAIIALSAYWYFQIERSIKSPNWKQLYVFSSITVVFIGVLAIIIPIATDFKIEQVHILKYGILSLLIFFSQKNVAYLRRFLLTLLLSSLAGISEETVQIWIPDRVFDLRDIALNLVSCFIGSLYAFLLSYSARKAFT